VEPFGGGASVLIRKDPSPVEVYNDLNYDVYEFFRVLSDETMFSQFYRRVECLPYHRAIFLDARDRFRSVDCPVERAALWFIMVRQSFGGDGSKRRKASWGSVVSHSSRGMAGKSASWISTVEMLPEISARLRRVQFECVDWRDILRRYDTPETLFYLDPPYVSSTRRNGGKDYAHEMTDADHADLVDALLKIKGRYVLSGYPSDIYEPLESSGAMRLDFDVACHAAGKTRATGIMGKGACDEKQRRTDCLWISPEKGFSLS
jgi:DNA adenine methylase